MKVSEDELKDVLERARQPSNQTAVEAVASRVNELKRDSELCTSCERPCRENEICATVAVHELELLEQVGRDQAFHYVESGMMRSQLASDAAFRRDGEKRPNTFLEFPEFD